MTRKQFTDFVTLHQEALRRFLMAMCCGDDQLADDMAQETLIKAYLSCDGLRDDARFKTWVFRIAINVFLNHRRSVRPTVEVSEATAVEVTEGSDGSFRYEELYAALGRIPERERSAILLFYMEGYSVREIAVMVEVSNEVVRQYLSRGRRHLREIMK